MKIQFSKGVIVGEIIGFLLCFLLATSSYQDTSKKNLVTERGQVDYITSRKIINIYLLKKEYNLRIAHWDILNYSNLWALEKGDIISFTHTKSKYGEEWLNYMTGNLEIVALESERNGSILSLKDYLEESNFWVLVVVKVIIGGFFLLLTLAIIYGWVLALMLFMMPYRYQHFKDHVLVQHKLVRGKVH